MTVLPIFSEQVYLPFCSPAGRPYQLNALGAAAGKSASAFPLRDQYARIGFFGRAPGAKRNVAQSFLAEEIRDRGIPFFVVLIFAAMTTPSRGAATPTA